MTGDVADLSTTASIRRSLGLLEPSDRRRYWLVVVAQCSLALLDVVGVLMVGAVAAVAVASIDGDAVGGDTGSAILGRVGLGDVDAMELMLIVALIAAALLTTKSLVSLILVRKQFVFLARQQERVSGALASSLIGRPLDVVQQRTSQETAYALMEGVNQSIVVLLGAVAVAVAEATILVLIGAVLLVLYPIATLASACLMVGVAWIVHRVLGERAGLAGTQIQEATVLGLGVIQETIDSYREITVLGRHRLSQDRVREQVAAIAQAQSRLLFTAQVPKYVLETALILGVLLLVLVQSAYSTPAQAVTMVALFLTAGSRVMPSLLRFQSALISARHAAKRSTPTYLLATVVGVEVRDRPDPDGAALARIIRSGYDGFDGRIELSGVSYVYPGSVQPVVSDVTLTIEPGEFLAVVGPSGAGKSTLADLILGVIEPTSGTVLISGVAPAEAVRRWPGALAYVPQAVGLNSGSIRANVALDLPRDDTDDDRVWSVLEQTRLADVLRSNRDGLDTLVGERGIALSGGQRQRLGIARALYSAPSVLIMDEATSSLDAESEAAISDVTRHLSRNVTLVTIAHRLATVRSSTRVAYLDGGRVVATGTFESVRESVPAFDRQARLLGL